MAGGASEAAREIDVILEGYYSDPEHLMGASGRWGQSLGGVWGLRGCLPQDHCLVGREQARGRGRECAWGEEASREVAVILSIPRSVEPGEREERRS